MLSRGPKSTSEILEFLPLSSALPVIAAAILCVWATLCSPVHESAPEPALVHESAPDPAPLHESALEPAPVHESDLAPAQVQESAPKPAQALELRTVLAPTCEFLACPVLTTVVTCRPSASPVMAKVKPEL